MSDPAVIWLRGSDLALAAQWLDAAGAAVNMTGMLLTPFEVTPSELAAHITAAVTDGAAGRFSISIPWNDDVPTGTGPRIAFRIRPNHGLPLEEVIPVTLK